MKINAIYIDGFGKFSGLSIEDLPSGLVVYKGANEAGKSTLLTFIRRMFFGIPNSKLCNFYPPLEGGQHGGRLVINNSYGERCIIERNAGRKDDVKVRLPNGIEGGKVELIKLLDHADRNIFENVYAFGLEELQSFDTLNDKSINSKLYCAGTGVGVSISELLESISRRGNDLYKAKGTKPKINELFKEIVQTQEKIVELEGIQKKYDALHIELEQKSELIERLKEESQNVKRKYDHIQSLLSIWDDWRDFQESRASLNALPELESFPEKGEEKALRLQKRLSEFRETNSGFQQELEKNGIRESEVLIDDKLLRKKNEVLELVGGVEKYRSECQNIPLLEMKLKEEKTELSEQLLELGPSWNEDILNHFDRSIPAKEAIIKMQRAIDEVESDIKATSSKLEQIVKSIDKCLLENNSFDENLLIHKDVITELGNGIAKHGADKKFCLSGEQELQNKKIELREMISGLGNGWDEESLNCFDYSLPAKEKVLQKWKEIEKTTKIIEKTQDLMEGILTEIDELHEELDSVEEKLNGYSTLLDSEYLNQRLEVVSYLRVKYPLLKEKEAELKNLEKDQEKEEFFYEAFRHKENENDAKTPLWPAGIILASGCIGLVYGYMNGLLLPGVVIFLLLSATSIAYFLTVRKKAPVSFPLPEQQKKNEVKNKNVQNSKEQLSEELTVLKEDMKIRAKRCEFEEIPDPFMLEKKANELQNLKDKLKTAEDLRLQHEKLRKKLDKLSSTYSSLGGTFKSSQERQKEILEEWRQELVSLRISSTLSLENVLEIFSSIRACFEKQKTITELEKQIRITQEAVSKYETEAQGILKACGKSSTGEGLENEIAKLREEVNIAFNQAERMKTLEAEKVGLEKEKKDMESQLRNKEKVRNDLSSRWSQWLVSSGLDPLLSLDSVIGIFAGIRTCFDKQRSIRSLKEQIAANRESIKAYEAKISGLLQECNRPLSGISFDTEVEKLRLDLEAEYVKIRDLEQLKIKSKELEIELQNALGRRDECKKEIEIILAAGWAETEEQFFENAKIWNRRTALKSRIYEAERQIRRVSGDGIKYEAFVEELHSADPVILQDERQQLEDSRGDLIQKILVETDNRGAIKNQIKQLEYEDGGSLTRLYMEGLRKEIHEKSRIWASLVFAEKILKRAIEVYEKERQPAVIVEAQAFFSKITGGRYTRIYSPLNTSEIFIEDREGRQKDITELSRGTAEQLYLSLRFGFIREFERHSEPLPIVFDDILVNFDPERCKNTCEAIKDLVSTNQVFYFTCHPETVQMLSEKFSGCRIVDLDKVQKKLDVSLQTVFLR